MISPDVPPEPTGEDLVVTATTTRYVFPIQSLIDLYLVRL